MKINLFKKIKKLTRIKMNICPIAFTTSFILSEEVMDLLDTNPYATKNDVIFNCSFTFGIPYFIVTTLLPDGKPQNFTVTIVLVPWRFPKV